MKFKYILSLTLMSLVLSSCFVSKRKYDNLLISKRSCDRKNRGLNQQISGLEEDLGNRVKELAVLGDKVKNIQKEYNNLKYDMSASNAQKSSQIDQLSKKLNTTIKDKKSITAETAELKNNVEWLKKMKELNRDKIDSLKTVTHNLYQKTELLLMEKNEKVEAKKELEGQITTLKEKLKNTHTLLKKEQDTNKKLQAELAKIKKDNEIQKTIKAENNDNQTPQKDVKE